jgi:hypothetical protein
MLLLLLLLLLCRSGVVCPFRNLGSQYLTGSIPDFLGKATGLTWL